jgi:hypothetical protein
MSGDRTRRYTVDPAKPGPPALTAAQVRALAAPARQDVVDVLNAAGRLTLYHHLARLTKAKLIAVVDEKRVGRRTAAVYDLCVRPLRLTYAGPAKPKDIAKVIAGAQRMTWREFQRALRGGGATTEGPQRTLWGARAKGWATPERLARINQLLAELLETVGGGKPEPGATAVAVSFLLAPAYRSPRAKAVRTQTPSPSAEAAAETQTWKEDAE